jgi:hypothetical protein
MTELLSFGTLESGPLVILMCLTLKGESYTSLTLLYVIKSKLLYELINGKLA